LPQGGWGRKEKGNGSARRFSPVPGFMCVITTVMFSAWIWGEDLEIQLNHYPVKK
jgi:hypothetical protein